MTDERRYRDEEVAEIFEAAATPRPSRGRAVTSADGLTLAELQSIGREVGVAPERIADAAAALDQRRSVLPRQSSLRMPISVGRYVDLPRAPTDREWELLVAELRETFGARGKEQSRGNLRDWTNGNLHAYVEPTETGYRLRLGTLKGDAVALNRLGMAGLLAGLGMFAFLPLVPAADPATPGILAVMGAAALASNALRLPRWAQKREEQMEYIANRARTLMITQPDPDAGN